MCRDQHQHFELFQDINRNHDAKYHPFPRWFVLSSTTLLPSVQYKLVRVSCYTLRSMLSSNCPSLPWSINICYVKNVVRISPPLENSWYIITSRHLRSFLGPSLLFLTGILTTGLWCVNSKLLATLLFEVNGRYFILGPLIIESSL